MSTNNLLDDTIVLERTQAHQLKYYSYTIRDFCKVVGFNEYIKINSLIIYEQIATRKPKMEEKSLGINLTSDELDAWEKYFNNSKKTWIWRKLCSVLR